MFIQNKYYKIYNRLCQRGQTRTLPQHIYKERHHVLPRSLGGNNTIENITTLTAREHFIAHLLLVKFTTGVNKSKMINAWFRMCCQKNSTHFNFITSRQFEQARTVFAGIAGWYMRGKKYEDIYGLKNAKRLKTLRSITKSKERKNKTWEEIFGTETAARMKKLRGEQARVWNKGRKHSEETKKLLSIKKTNYTYLQCSCVICKKIISNNNLAKHYKTH